MNRKIFDIAVCLLTSLLLLTAPQEAYAKKARKGRKAKTEAAAPAKKKTAYDKFVTKKGTQKIEGFFTVYRSGNDIYFEIPDSLIGRRMIQSTILEKSAALEMSTGMELSHNLIYQIARTDSLILLQSPKMEFVVEDGDEGIRRALESSMTRQTLIAMPIKYRNADSTASVVKANTLFDLSRKEVVDFSGLNFGTGLKISKGNFKKDLSRTMGLDCHGNTIQVRNEATYELSLYLSGFGYESSAKPKFTSELLTSLTLMPESTLPRRKADSRVGVRKINYQVYKSSGAIEVEQLATRWDISDGQGITVYVDTLLGPSWMEAVKKGLLAWNPAFEKAGYKDVIKVLPYPSDDPSFRTSDPYISTVSFSGGTSIGLSADILTDTSTGEILSARIQVPGDFVLGVRRASVYKISDVDTRYQSYWLSDEAVCEVLAAKVMSTFGQCLGLSRNLAGASAYSPAQLKDVEFTQKNGITASVTDDVLFNVFASPGDKEKGLVTVVDRIGPYDEYAVEWLYGHEGPDSEQQLKALVDSHEGDPVYFFAPSVRGRVTDPRIAKEVLGNDVFAYHEAVISHLKFVAANADRWLADDAIPQTYTDLFIDWLWLGMNDAAFCLTANIGGMYAGEVKDGRSAPKFVPVSEELQRKSLRKVFDTYYDVTWMDANKTLLQLPGANKDITRFTNVNLFNLSDFGMRLMYVSMAEVEAGSTYTVQEYMDDVEKLVFQDIRKGKFVPAGDIILVNYLLMLARQSPVLLQNFKDFMEPGARGFAAEADFRVSLSGVPVEYVEEFDILAWRYVQRARNILKQGKAACRNDYDRRKMDYLVTLVDALLEKQ